MILAGRLAVPTNIAAMLFDMDGVLLDTLSMDLDLVNRLVGMRCGAAVTIPASVVRTHFPHQLNTFWPMVLRDVGISLPDAEIEKLVLAHEQERRTTAAPVHEGITEILRAAKDSGLAVGVVSNNPIADVDDVLRASGLRDWFDVVVGNDMPGSAPKPAPDPYLRGAQAVGYRPGQCIAIEDSILGVESASRAGCYTIAVATGSASFEDLTSSPYVDQCYRDFSTIGVRADGKAALTTATRLRGATTSTPLYIRPHITSATRYVPEWLGIDRSAYLRLDRNESTRPVSDEVALALTDHIRTRGVFSYPESDRLAGRLASYCGVPSESVVVTNGSDQGIDLCLRVFLDKGDRMLVARPEFSVFNHVAELVGARVVGVPYDDNLGFPYEQFSEAAKQQPSLIVLINPNNPTGTPIDLDYVERIAAEHPNIPVLVDEAYYEFTGVTAAGLVPTYPNVIVLRTFSKAFAMAGLRIGYVLAHPDIAAEIRKLRNPFDVNELAVIAAETQLANLEPVRTHVTELMTVSKPLVVEFFRTANIPVWPGAANFVLVQPERCAEAVEFLRESGILVRSMSASALSGMFRMSLGTPDEMTDFIRAYRNYLSHGELEVTPGKADSAPRNEGAL